MDSFLHVVLFVDSRDHVLNFAIHSLFMLIQIIDLSSHILSSLKAPCTCDKLSGHSLSRAPPLSMRTSMKKLLGVEVWRRQAAEQTEDAARTEKYWEAGGARCASLAGGWRRFCRSAAKGTLDHDSAFEQLDEIKRSETEKALILRGSLDGEPRFLHHLLPVKGSIQKPQVLTDLSPEYTENVEVWNRFLYAVTKWEVVKNVEDLPKRHFGFTQNKTCFIVNAAGVPGFPPVWYAISVNLSALNVHCTFTVWRQKKTVWPFAVLSFNLYHVDF